MSRRILYWCMVAIELCWPSRLRFALPGPPLPLITSMTGVGLIIVLGLPRCSQLEICLGKCPAARELHRAKSIVIWLTTGIARDRYDLLRFNGLKRSFLFRVRVEGLCVFRPSIREVAFALLIVRSLPHTLWSPSSVLPLLLAFDSLEIPRAMTEAAKPTWLQSPSSGSGL